MKIKSITFNKIKKLPWILKQPLAKIPKNKFSVISDLFVWRKTNNIDTFFEILDLPGLFHEKSSDRINNKKIMFIFNSNGEKINEVEIKSDSFERKTIKISDYIDKKIDDSYGTFCVFHSSNPESVVKLNSFISDRGYISYKLNEDNFKSYVHGNIDAVSYDNFNLVNLGASSLFKRNYNLQFEMFPDIFYEFFITNYSRNKKKFELIEYKNEYSTIIDKIEINPRGCGFFKYVINKKNIVRISIRSSLVMARPLVFSFGKKSNDAFHG